MSKNNIKTLFAVIAFSLFIGSLYCRIEQALFHSVTALLFLLPGIIYIAINLVFPDKYAGKDKMTVFFRHLTFSIILAALTSALLSPRSAIFYVPRPIVDLFGISENIVVHLGFSTYFIIIFILSLVTTAVLTLVRYHHSILTLTFITTIIFMLLFSYADRAWNYLFPLHLGGAVFFQACLRENLDRGLGLAAILTLSFSIGSAISPFTGIWFQASANDALASVRSNALFAWNKANLGQAISPSNKPIFYVQSPSPQYWRCEVYDTFSTNQTWIRSGNSKLDRTASPFFFPVTADSIDTSRLPTPVANDQKNFNSEVKALYSLSAGVGLPLPRFSSTVSLNDNYDFFYQCKDWGMIITSTPLKKGQIYSAQSTPISYDADDLRKIAVLPFTTQEYRHSVYYENPAIPALARSITANAQNPYDKIMALVEYLKSTGTYTLSPEPSSDFLTTFLFGKHEGYCVHFSSALVVLAQSLNFPARWVIGFNNGEPLPPTWANPFPDQPRSTVRVLTQANAHSWAEIYFPGYGWVPFEATPGFSSLISEPLPETDPSKGGESSLPLPSSSRIKPEDNGSAPASSTSGLGRTTAKISWLKVALPLLILLTAVVFLYWRHKKYMAKINNFSSDREQIRNLYGYWRQKLTLINIDDAPHLSIQEYQSRLLHLGDEWNSTWTEFSFLAEQAYYAPLLLPGNTIRLPVLLKTMERGYKQTYKALSLKYKIRNRLKYWLIILPRPKKFKEPSS